MTGTAAAALLQMSTCISSAGAEHWARIAYERGATREDIREAWKSWRAERAAEVQIIGGES